MERDIQKIDLRFAINEIEKVKDKEDEICNIFVEMLKDEIDSNDEGEIYNGIKKLIFKYIDNENALQIIDEVIEVITAGASMTEVLLVAKDEVIEPVPVNVMDLENLTNHNLKDKNMDSNTH